MAHERDGLDVERAKDRIRSGDPADAAATTRAVKAIGDSGVVRLKQRLELLLLETTPGVPSEPDKDVRRAAGKR